MANKKIVLHTDWFDVESEEYDLPQLHGKPIYRINAPDSVLLVCFTQDKKLILVRQFRPASNQFTVELPAGAIEKGETPEEAAHRELYEETGYKCKKLELVSKGRLGADRVNSFIYIFFGIGAEKDKQVLSDSSTEVKALTIGELKEFVTQDSYRQFSGLGALLLTKWRLNPPELISL